jgi:hypothetical protein
MKIGITTDKIDKLFCNGLRFNVILWYDFLEKCGYEPYFLCNTDETYKNYRFIKMSDILLITELQYVFTIGVSKKDLYDFIKVCNIKLIYVMLGNEYYSDTEKLCKICLEDKSYFLDYYDEIWISPHFERSKEYYKVKYNTEKVFICPYFWKADLLLEANTFNKITCNTSLQNLSKLNIAIVEPNLSPMKNCLIPFAICEKAHNYINKINIFCANKCKEFPMFKQMLLKSKLQKEDKLRVENRYPITEILSKYSNCVVSCVENWDLNYIYMECFYLGIPLVHNSLMLKDYGYYYPDLNISKGVDQIKYLIQHHNRTEYIEKHKSILEKYSVNNPLYIAWTKSRIENNKICIDV